MKNPDSRQASSGFEQTSSTPKSNYIPETELSVKVRGIVAEYPDLGREGFAVPYVSPAVDRDSLSSQLFLMEVMMGLQYLSQRGVGQNYLVCRSDYIAREFKTCTAAAIVACQIAGYRICRIEGQRHAEILRAKNKGPRHG
ncbi:MAG: hypothetical protein Q7J38_05530 [Gallionella sp.]|nr:hypothetical protein [Gallionella sp.]